jgi:hypothetical protein
VADRRKGEPIESIGGKLSWVAHSMVVSAFQWRVDSFCITRILESNIRY